MDGDASDVDFLLAAATHEIEALAGDTRLRPLPGKRGAALRVHLLDLIGAVQHRMKQRPSPGSPPAVRRAFARSMRQTIHVLRGAHAALPWLAATRAPNVNLGSLYFTEECARLLVGSDVDLVVVPDPEFMYSTTSWPFAPVIASTPGFVPQNTRRPIVLNYPLTDSDRLLLHPIFAHELGHSSVSEHDLVAMVEGEIDADASFTTALAAAIDQLAVLTGASHAEVSGTIRVFLRDWIEELLCDHLAAEAAGPAFLWAFASFVLPLGYGEPGPEYPPNTVRVRLTLEHLTRRGWRPYMERVAPRITAWLDDIAADSSNSSHQPPFDFLCDQLVGHAGLLQDCAIGVSAGSHLDPAQSVASADEASDLLARLILPVGLQDPLEARSILLGGWQQAFTAHGDAPAGIIAALGDDRLQELVGKAIEMSTVAALWSEAP